jgi:hypothetical protein
MATAPSLETGTSNDALVRGGLIANIWRGVYRFSRGVVLIHYTTEFMTPPTCAEHNARRAGNTITYPQFPARPQAGLSFFERCGI